MAKTKLTARQRKVIKTGAANVADKYDLKPMGQKRFARSAKRAITASGHASPKSKAYRQAIVQAARTETTKKEAKGVKRVLRRADVAATPKRRTAATGRKGIRGQR